MVILVIGFVVTTNKPYAKIINRSPLVFAQSGSNDICKNGGLTICSQDSQGSWFIKRFWKYSRTGGWIEKTLAEKRKLYGQIHICDPQASARLQSQTYTFSDIQSDVQLDPNGSPYVIINGFEIACQYVIV